MPKNTSRISLVKLSNIGQWKFTVNILSHFSSYVYGLPENINIQKQYKNICVECICNTLAFNNKRAKEWCIKNNPSLCIFDVDKNIEYMFKYKGGLSGVQSLFFKFGG